MDNVTATIIALIIIALVFIAFFAVFRKRGSGKIIGPFGISLEVEGSNESPPVNKTESNSKIEHPFEITGISLPLPSYPRYLCQIRVHNRTLKTADNVRVELVEMETSTEESEKSWLPNLPLLLSASDSSEQSTINPGGSLVFSFFNVTKHKSAHQPNLQVWHHYVIAKFAVSTLEEKATPFGKAALFKNNKNHRIKIRVTARDFSPTETEFNLNFTGEDESCCFTLTPNRF
jgi:hypothetical protein